MQEQLENIREFISLTDKEQLSQLFTRLHGPDILELWNELDAEEKIVVFRSLNLEQKVELLGAMPLSDQENIIQNLPMENIRQLFEEFEPDDLVDIIQQISPDIRKSIWESLSDEARKEMAFLLRFDEDDAAGLMTPRYIALRGSVSVAQAFHFIRNNIEEVETIYYVYVLDELRRLIGVVSIRDLMSTRDEVKISDIMQSPVISVRDDTDQEEVAILLRESHLLAVPVIDKNHILLGIVTVDDVIQVIRDEHTEDIYKMGAMEGSTKPYLETSVFGLMRKRLPWLSFLLLAGTITTNVLAAYKGLIASAAFLTLFIPVITQTGGNSGTQSSTLIIRGLATGEIKSRNFWRVLFKEITVGLLLGAAMGIIIFLRGVFLPPGIQLWQAVSVSASLIFVVIFSTVTGALVPLLLQKIKLDPTVAAGPLMSTLIDVCGLTIFFEVSSLILSL